MKNYERPKFQSHIGARLRLNLLPPDSRHGPKISGSKRSQLSIDVYISKGRFFGAKNPLAERLEERDW